MRASIQRNGHTRSRTLMQSTVGKRAQQKPGKLANVRYTLYELFGPKKIKKKLLMLWLYGVENSYYS